MLKVTMALKDLLTLKYLVGKYNLTDRQLERLVESKNVTAYRRRTDS